MKRPAFQFYPADWRKDPALSACSLAARGLWIELMCIAHEADQYGVLTVNGKPMSNAQIARMVGETPKALERLLTELEEAGVFSRNEEGAIFSRRMVKDEAIRSVRAEAGKKGGNPSLLNQKDNHLLKQTGKQSPTPSSSSSSSDNSHSQTRAPQTGPGDDLLSIPGLSGYHPEDWQPDRNRLAAFLLRAGIPMPDDTALANSLTRFNLHNAGKVLTETQTYSKLVTWLTGDHRNAQRAPTHVSPASAGAQPARRQTPVDRAVEANREYLRQHGLDPESDPVCG